MFGKRDTAAISGTVKPATATNPAPPSGGGECAPLQPIEIFRAGRHTNNAGFKITITPDDLQACAENYDPERFAAPLVVGHPKTDDPAYGWVKSLEHRNGVLYATPKGNVDNNFSDAVNGGKYNRVSAAFHAPHSSQNPKQGVHYLKHVGFLGGVAPAVKGMKPARIAPDEPGPLLFSECDLMFSDTPPEWRRTIDPINLAERERAIARAEDEALVDHLSKTGRLLPWMRAPALAFCDAMDDGEVIEFAEGDETRTVGMKAAFKDFLKKMPKLIEFAEVAGGDGPTRDNDGDIDLPPGVSASPEHAALHAKAKAHQRKHGGSYRDAVFATMN